MHTSSHTHCVWILATVNCIFMMISDLRVYVSPHIPVLTAHCFTYKLSFICDGDGAEQWRKRGVGYGGASPPNQLLCHSPPPKTYIFRSLLKSIHFLVDVVYKSQCQTLRYLNLIHSISLFHSQALPDDFEHPPHDQVMVLWNSDIVTLSVSKGLETSSSSGCLSFSFKCTL